jgi:ectoine hydroxylase-related dioxygenase (phytanoyl-CoA dioxygenase family)
MDMQVLSQSIFQDRYVVNQEDQHFFRKNGYILLPGVAGSDEISLYRPAINNAVKRLNTESRNLEDRDTYGKAFLQIINLWAKDEEVKKYTLAEKFAKIAADLLGVEKVRIYHDQALYKEPGGGPTPWHQDQYYWPLDTQNTVTMWMPLVDLDESMGILTFAAGSHKDGLVENIAISDQSEEVYNNYVQNKKYPVYAPPSMKAGDATFHYGYTLHKAPGNQSGTMREIMTVIYFADGARVTAPVNKEQEADRDAWLGGLEPGKLAASKLNPLI